MADKVEEPMENSADEEEEMERPPTPDYHHEGNEEVSSEISDDEDKEKDDSKQEQTRNVTESPVSEADKDEGDEKELEIVSSPSDSENLDENDVKNVENKIDSVDNTDSISNDNDNDPLDKENIQTDNDNEEEEVDNEEEEIEDKEDNEEEIEEDNEKENDEKEKPRKGSEEQENEEQDIDNEEEESVDSPVKSDNESEVDKKNTDKIKNSSNDDEESVEKEENAEEEREASEESMPLSPIGLGLSEPETALVDKILKEDAEENMPEDNSMDSKEGTSEKIENDEDDSQENEEEKVEKSVASDNEEDDEEKPDRSEDADDQDEEGSEPDEAGGDQLIQDIFGASDEEEEFEGFDQEEIDVSRSKEATSKSMISDDEDEGVTGEVTESMVVPKPKDDKEEDSESDEEEGTSGTVWDFDLMMEEKKANRAKKRRRKGEGEFISDSDDLVVEMIKQMKQAAEDDRMLNEAKQAATKKLKLLPLILKHLNKADLQYTFIDSGILNGLKDWLSPLPDGSLPHLQIRTGLLKILSSFPKLDTGALKVSGLGKAVMYVYRHPKEIRYNKDMAGKLINEWARPIFGVTSNFKSMSREEREERDYQNMSKRRRLSSAEEGGKTPRSIDRALQGEKKAARPGEKGFIMRARVPLPSNKDYVVRPKSNLDPMDFHRVNKSVSLADKQLRKLKDRKKSKAPTHAATVSVEGRKMAL